MTEHKHIHVHKHHEENVQQKIVEYELYKNGIDSLARELSLVNSSISNLSTAKSTLEAIKNLKEKNELLVPIGGNIFLKANLKDKDSVLAGIGPELLLKKDLKSATKTIDEQVDELTDARKKMEDRIRELSDKMAKLEPELRKFSEELRKKAEK